MLINDEIYRQAIQKRFALGSGLNTLSETKDIQNIISNFEEKMVDTETKLGINPLELWMNEMIAKKRKQEDEKTVEQ